jgi:hypothetical protein
MGCLSDLLMYSVVAPGLGVLVAIAFISGDPALLVVAIAVSALAFCLYLLATWDD